MQLPILETLKNNICYQTFLFPYIFDIFIPIISIFVDYIIKDELYSNGLYFIHV